MNIYLTTLGCRLNEAEVEMWAKKFSNMGHSIVTNPNNANIMLLNSCAVTGEASRKSRQYLRKLHKINPMAKIVATGCYITLEKNNLPKDLNIDLAITNSQKDKTAEIVNEKFKNHKAMPQMAIIPGQTEIFPTRRKRAFIKVQDGCSNKCSFCIVTIARGGEKSRKIKDIINEINELETNNHIKEIVISGVHLGGYGSDINQSLTTLLKEISKETSIPRIRMGSLEPWCVNDDLIEVFSNKRFMPHMHLPLQSGCDATLKRMSRRCMTKTYKNVVQKLKQADINLTTDIIVGFPGETEEEWLQSKNFIKTMVFSDIHIFSYSPRAGTKAATLSGQVDSLVKQQRSKELHEIAQNMKIEFLKQQNNKKTTVLWEKTQSDNGQKYITGYSENYCKIIGQDIDEKMINQISQVQLLWQNNHLTCSVLKNIK